MICAGAVAACVPDGGVPFIEVISAADPGVRAAELLGDTSSTSLDTARLGPIAGDVGTVRYHGDQQKRVYLFTGDISAGVSTGSALHLPQQPVPFPDSSTPLAVDITPFDPNQWMSVRAYDVGLCSAPPIPELLADLVWENLATTLTQGLDVTFATSLAARRVEPAGFTPVLRTNDTYDPQGDRLRFRVTYFAPNVGGRQGCDDVTLRIAAELGWKREPAVISYPPQCLHPSDPGHVFATQDGTTWDFVGVVHSVQVRASSSGCVVLGDIEEGLEDELRAGLPHAFGQGILDALLVDPELFGVPLEDIRPCTCDTQCSSLSPEGPLPYGVAGRRHRCKLTRLGPEPCGECWVQLDPDRLHARPEGLEVVVAEDEDDPQAAALLSSDPGRLLLCNPGRAAVRSDRPPERLPLPGEITIPLLPLPEPEPFCRREDG